MPFAKLYVAGARLGSQTTHVSRREGPKAHALLSATEPPAARVPLAMLHASPELESRDFM